LQRSVTDHGHDRPPGAIALGFGRPSRVLDLTRRDLGDHHGAGVHVDWTSLA
jgi:hypothetical protein